MARKPRVVEPRWLRGPHAPSSLSKADENASVLELRGRGSQISGERSDARLDIVWSDPRPVFVRQSLAPFQNTRTRRLV